MRTIGSKDGDIQFEVIDGLESVSQRLAQRLRFLRGEWFLRKQRGLPYLIDLLGTPEDRQLAQQIITAESLDVEDVLEVLEVTFGFNSLTRKQSISIRVSTLYGTATVSVEPQEPAVITPPIPTDTRTFWSLGDGDDFWSLGDGDDFWSLED